jgi:hypothetical protein
MVAYRSSTICSPVPAMIESNSFFSIADLDGLAGTDFLSAVIVAAAQALG